MNPDFLRQIWANPTDYSIRLIYADWLDERGHYRAANRQRNFAFIIRDSCQMYWLKRWEWIIGSIYRNNGHLQDFRVKKDSTITLLPYFSNLVHFDSFMRHRIK